MWLKHRYNLWCYGCCCNVERNSVEGSSRFETGARKIPKLQKEGCNGEAKTIWWKEP